MGFRRTKQNDQTVAFCTLNNCRGGDRTKEIKNKTRKEEKKYNSRRWCVEIDKRRMNIMEEKAQGRQEWETHTLSNLKNKKIYKSIL